MFALETRIDRTAIREGWLSAVAFAASHQRTGATSCIVRPIEQISEGDADVRIHSLKTVHTSCLFFYHFTFNSSFFSLPFFFFFFQTFSLRLSDSIFPSPFHYRKSFFFHQLLFLMLFSVFRSTTYHIWKKKNTLL